MAGITVHIYARVDGDEEVFRVGEVEVDPTASERRFLRAFEAAFKAMSRIAGPKENR